MSGNSDIELVQTALVEFDKVGAGLTQLQKNYAGVLFEVETPKGMEHAKAARQVLRQPRYAIEKIRKDAKAPLLAIGKKLDAEAARITSEIMKLEDPIDQQIKSEEDRKEREKLAAAAAEAKRVSDIQARVEAIRNLPVRAAGKTPAQILAIQTEAAAIVIDGTFAEFAEQAAAALNQSSTAISGLYAAAVAAETEAARVVAERAELERLRAEQAQRDADERTRLAEEDRRAREQRDRERAEQDAALKIERDKLAAERAEQDRLAQAERDRVAAEDRERREAAAREQAQLDAQREQMRKDQEALRAPPVQPKGPTVAAAARPTDEQIAAVVAEYFHVSPETACQWLAEFGIDKAA